jgi:hypothetical protein
MTRLSIARLAGGFCALVLLGAADPPPASPGGVVVPGVPKPARNATRPTLPGEIWVVLENPNSARGHDLLVLFDKVCNVELPAVSLRGHGSESFPICGGLGQPGALRIRYSGEQVWTDVDALHGWAVIEAPRRPMGLSLKPVPLDDE